jgi:hypothetical protein
MGVLYPLPITHSSGRLHKNAGKKNGVMRHRVQMSFAEIQFVLQMQKSGARKASFMLERREFPRLFRSSFSLCGLPAPE